LTISMVLNDASPQADGFGDGSSSDAYSSSDSNNPLTKYYPLQIKPELMKRPGFFTMYAGFGGRWFWQQSVQLAIQQRVEASFKILKRSPTQEELDALVEHTSQQVNGARVGVPLGMMAGALHTYIQVPREIDLPKDVPFHKAVWDYVRVAKTADVSGLQKLALGTFVRVFGWTLIGYVCTSAMATYKEMAHVIKDPRLERFRQALSEAAAQRKTGPGGVIQRERTGAPTGTAEQPVSGYGESQTYASDSTNGERKGQPELWRRPVPDRQRTTPATATANQTDNNSSSGLDLFDDASPVAAEHQKSFPSASTSGNAWDRIRQQSAGVSDTTTSSNPSNPWGTTPQKSSTSSQRENQTRSSGSDSYANEEQLAQREREQEQREFERMLEAERSVGQESTNTSGKGGWRRW
jgi:hypothetical protein